MCKLFLFSLTLVFFSTVSAQVTTLTAWTNAYHGTSASAQTATVTVPAGSGAYRCMVVAIASDQTGVAARTVTLTYGGQSFTASAGDMATATVQQHTQLYYLNEAGIDAASNTTLSVTVSGGTTRVTDVWYSIYDFVEQTTPVTDSKNYNSGASTTTNPVFSSALTVNNNDLAVEVISSFRVGTANARTITYAGNWTMSNEQTFTITDGVRNAVANRSIPSGNTTDASSTTFSGTALGSMSAMSLKFLPKQFRSNATNVTWGTAVNWQQSTDGGVNWVTATTAPTSADGLVTIQNGHTVTLAAAATASSLTINAGGALNTSGTAANTLTVTGAITIAGTITFANTGTHTFSGDIIISGTWNETAASGFSIVGNFTNNATSFTAGTGTHTFTGSAKTLSGSTITAIPNTTITGTYTNNGTLTVSTALAGTGTLTQGAGSTLNIGGSSLITGLGASANTNTVNYTGTTQTLKVVAYNNLGLSGSGAKTFGAITTIGGNLTMTGTTSITTGAALAITGNLSVGTGTTFATGATNTWTLTVSGTTDVTGTLTLANTGAKSFTGNVTLNAGAVWNETGAAVFGFAGNLQNNATTFTASTGVHTFSGAGKTLSGSTTIAIPNTTITGTYTNSGTMTVSTALAGAGTLTQGGSSTLNIGGTSAITGLAASANTNTVNYTGAAQTVKAVAYSTLGLGGSLAKTLTSLTTIGVDLNLSGTATATTAAALTIGGNLNIGNGTTFTAAGFALTVTGNTTVGTGTSGTLTISSATGTKAFNGNLTLNAGATFNNTAANASLTLPGSLSSSGTFNAGTGVYTFSGTSKTIAGTITIASVTVTGSCTNNGTLTVSTALSGTGTLTQGASATLNIGNTSGITGLDASTNTNTVNYTRVGTQTVKAVNYSSLGISGGGSSTKTLGGSLTVSGTLTIAATTILTFGNTAITLTLSGTASNRLVNNGTLLMNGSNAAHVLQIAASSIATFGTFTTGTGSTVEYNANGVQTVSVITYNHLKLSGSGTKTFAVTSVSGNMELSGTASLTTAAALTVGGTLTIGSGTSFTAAAFGLTVTGATIVGGTLTISSSTGTKAFNGDLTVNSGGTFTNTASNVPLTLPGNISVSGAFNGGTGVYTLSGTNKTISGTLSILNITVSGTYTNNGNLTVGTALSGTGTLTQGLNSNLSMGGTYTITGLVATANGNTITYSGTGAQNVRAIAYQNLEVNNSANLTLLANTDVQENVTLTNGKINLSTFNLNVTGGVLGAGSARYIATTGTGRLQLIVGNSPITFPVGNSTYNPLIMTNAGTSDVFGVRVIDAVTSPAVNSSTLLVNRFWNIAEGDAGGSNLTLTAQWSTVNQNAGYAGGTNVKFAYNNGTVWTEVMSSQSGSNPSITADGSFNVWGDDLTGGRAFGVGKDAGFLAATASITAGTVTAFGNQCVGSNSDEQSYTVSGVNLTGNIVVTAPTGFQVSTTSGSGFGSSVNLVATSGFVSPTPVFVRFSPGSATAFSSNITHVAGAASKNVAVSGTGGNFGPTVTTPVSSAIGATEVNLGGNITNLGCSTPTIRGIEYSTTNNFTNGTGTQVPQSGSFGTGTFTINVTGLSVSTTYYYKAYATNAQGTSYSTQGTFATLAGARYAVATGNWSSTSTWSTTSGGSSGASAPAAGQAVFIEGNKTVTVNAATAALNSLNIDAGSAVTTSSTFTLSATTINIDGTLNLSGTGTVTSTTLNINNGGVLNRTASQTLTVTTINVKDGGTFTHAMNGSSIPTANWSANSTLRVTAITSTALTGGLNQNFGNVVWNCTAQTVAQNFPTSSTMSIAGNLTITATNSGSLILNQTSLSVVNYTQTAGTFNLCNAAATRALNVTGDFSHTGGTISVAGNASAVGAINFSGTTIQTFTSGGTLLESAGKIVFNINTDAIVDFGTSIISSGASGLFTNSGTMITKNTAGITTSGATGTVQSTGIRNYNGTGSYVYNGSSAQVTGNGLVQCAGLTINNAAGVTLSSPVTINNAGFLSIGTITGNTICNDSGNQISVTGGSGTIDLTLSNGSTFNVGSAGTGTTIQDIGNYSLAAGTTIGYISAVAQTVNTDAPYQLLIFSGAGTKTVNGPLSVAQNWSTSGGLASMGSSTVTVDGNITGTGNIQFTSGTLNIEGDWTNTGTLTPGTGTIIFDGPYGQAIGSGTALSFNNLTITNDSTKTLGAAISCSGTLTVDNGLLLNTANFGVTLSGNLINNGTINGGSSSFTITGTAAQSIDRFATSGAISMTKTGGTATFVNNINGGSLSINGVGGTLSLGIANDIIITGNWTNTNGTLLGGSSTLFIGGATSSLAGGTFTAEDGTVEYNAAGGQAMAIVSYNNLNLSGSGAKTGAITTVNGNLSLTGTTSVSTGAALTIGGTLTIDNGTSLTAGAFPLTISGVTTVGGGTSGTLTINSATGAKVFNDDLIVNTGSSFNNSGNAPLTFAGGLSNAGSFSAGTGAYTLSGTDKDISGTLSIPSVSISGSYTNGGTLTIATALAGAGTLTQGSGSTLNIGGTTTITMLDASVSTNTVRFTNLTGGQSIPSSVYSALTLSNTSGTNTLSGSVTTNGLLTLSGGKLALVGNTVTINGALSGMNTSSCFVSDGTTSSIIIGGAGVLGTSLFLDQSVPGTTNRLADLTYNRSSQTITMGDTIEITGTLTPAAGTLATGDKLKLISNASGTARVAQGGGSYISGKVTVERYVPSVGRRWRFIGSPVSGTTLADLKNEIYITGGNGVTDGFDASSSNQPSVYSYDESVITGDLNSGYVAATNITNALTVGKGYRVFIRGDRSDAGRLNGTNSTQNAVTMNLIGPLNTGNINLSVTFTSSGVPANDGWNFVSNPYASPYSWDAFYDAQAGSANCLRIDPTIYIFDANSNGYKSYNAGSDAGTLTNGIIPAGAGFWVKATAANPALILSESYKSPAAPVSLFKTNERENFRIRLEADSTSYDELVVKYLTGSSVNKDMYDIRKLAGTLVNIGAYGNDNEYLSASVRPLSLDNDTIRFYVSATASGDYTLKFFNSEEIAVYENVLLIDTYLNTVTDLTTANKYPFTVNTGIAETQGLNRFYIVVANNTGLPVNLLTFGVNKGKNQTVELNWSTIQEFNNDRFEIERSADGIHFNRIGEVKGNGTTQRLIAYSFVDEYPGRINYYRLKQVDLGGSIHYSKVVVMEMDLDKPGLSLYPVPAITELTVSQEDIIKSIHVIDMNGVLQIDQQVYSTQETLDIRALSPGVYNIEVQGENGKTAKGKFVKQ